MGLESESVSHNVNEPLSLLLRVTFLLRAFSKGVAANSITCCFRHLTELDDFYRNTRRQDAAIQDKMAELGSELVKEFLDKIFI